MRPTAVLAAVLLATTAACGSSSGSNSVRAAQARVSSQEKAVADAQAAYDTATASFCKNTQTYVTAIDRYGKLFDDSSATVGDVKTAGADLRKPREDVTSSSQRVVDARDEVAKAEEELVDAQRALAVASSSSTAAPAQTTTTTVVPPASIDRVKQAESDLAAASEGTTDQTPLVQAAAEFNAAALSLELAWLRLFADAGCLTDAQLEKAQAALRDYTIALQTTLQTTGYYSGKVDGVYGPGTVEAVKKLQTANGLPVTGFVDEATAAALSAAVASKGGAVASDALAHTAAVQSTLKLAGYWTGPVDGNWTPELTTALKKFQTDLGVPATGSVDTATLAALERAIAEAKTSSPSSTAVPTTTTTG